MTSEVTDSAKIPTHGVRLEIDGTILQITRDTGHMYDYRTIDLSKYNLELNGIDQEGYLRLRIIPREPERIRSVKRKEIHHIYPTSINQETNLKVLDKAEHMKIKRTRRLGLVPQGFSLYSERKTEAGNMRRVFKNQAKSFIMILETAQEARKYTLGDLDDPASYISKVAMLIRDSKKSLTFDDINQLTYANHMSDSNKLRAALDVLNDKAIILKHEGTYTYIHTDPRNTQTIQQY